MKSICPTLSIAAVVVLLGVSSARAETSSERFEHVLGHVLKPSSPVEAATSVWEAIELAPLFVDGAKRLENALEKLSQSRVPFAAGEATLGLARLVLSGPADDAHRVASALAAKAGVLDAGLVLGPLPGPGTDAVIPSSEVAGKHGPTTWRAFSSAAPTGPLQLADLLPTSGDLHAFVATDLSVKSPTSALLLVGSNGPCAAWLNGEQLFAWDGERPLSPFQHAQPIQLGAGRHSLVFRAGHRSESPQLEVRIVDTQGLLPKGLAFVPRGPSSAGPPPKLPPLKSLWELARNELELGRLGVWSVREAAEERTSARRFETAIHASTKDLAELHYLLGRSERTDTSRARAAFEEADRFENGHVQALVQLISIAERQGLVADADAHARRLLALEPDHPALLSHLALRRLELSDAASALATLSGDPRLYSNGRLAATAASLFERAGLIRDAAIAYAALSRLSLGSSDATQRAVNLFRRASDNASALATATRALERRPNALDLAILRARVLANDETRLPEAISSLEDLRPLHPQSAELEETLGRLLLLADDRGRAITAFDRALELAPQNRDLADYRRSLVDERGLAEASAEPLAAIFDRAKMTPHSPDGAPALQLFERTLTRVFPSGLASQFRQVVIRIDQPSAAERFASMPFAYTPREDRLEILEAEVIKPDGARLRPESIKDERQEGKSAGVYTLTAYKVVYFPPLEPGDILHIQIRRDEIGDRNLFGDFFGVFTPISGELPKLRVEAIIEAPSHRTLHVGSRGVGDPVKTTSGDLQRLTFTLDHVPAIAIEPSMPGYGDIGAWISVSTFGTWDALATWYRELILPQLEVPSSLAEEARALVAPLETLEEKVTAIHRWVVTKTRYVGIEFGIHGFKPYKVAEVVQRGYGDCKDKASLLIALMRAVGIKGEFVLVRTRDLGSLEGSPPSLWTFNHAIAYVPELDLYLDGTAELSGLRELPELDQDAQVLRIDPWSTTAPILSRIPMQPPTVNRIVANATYVLSETGDAMVDFGETIAGSSAGRIRGQLADPTRRDSQIGAILAAQHSGTELESIAYENLEVIGRPVSIRARARMPGLATRNGATLSIPISLDPGLKLKSLAPLAVRRQPLIVTALEDELNIETYLLPEGARLENPPAPVVFSSPAATWQRVVTVNGQKIRVETRWQISVARIEASDYPKFRDLLAQIAREEGRSLTVVLAKK